MDRHAGGGRHAFGVAEILDRDRHAVQRAARAAGRGLGIARRGIGQRALGRQGGVALELGIEPLDAVEQRPGGIDGAELARLQLARDLVERHVVQWCRHAAMFAAMAPPLKGDGAQRERRRGNHTAVIEDARIAYSAVFRLTAADRPRSVAIS